MRKQLYKNLLLVLIFSMFSCQGQEKKRVGNNPEKKEDFIEQILKKQLEYGRPSFNNPYRYTNADLEVILPEVKKDIRIPRIQISKK